MESTTSRKTDRALWLDYLRSFITVLVVAHHAALAYTTFARFVPTRYIESTAPIVDQQRWVGLDVFVGFNDLFFMALMYFLSGLFVYRGLSRKGPKAYLADRVARLVVPFLIAELLLIPLAYWPSFYLATGTSRLDVFVSDYLTSQQWPVGPPWFIWLLLFFDVITALLFQWSSAFFVKTGRWLTNLSQHPLRFCAVLYGLLFVSLAPLSLYVGHFTWVGNWGPFDVQLNRVLFYLMAFGLGLCLGTTDWQSHLFRHEKLLGVNWPVWVGLSLLSYGLVRVEAEFGAQQVGLGHLTETQGYLLYDILVVGSCLASIAACLSLFRQCMNRPSKGWSSLSANAYAIYLVHYGFVTWLQFALLPVEWPAGIKCLLVFAGATSLSWLSSQWLRKNDTIAGVL
ncbi:acyltransferase family protein [Fibrella sp. WM1]|uniref:acyltransferase family protein n=1 Tax=Fibrella musci TaxID=3242485 RepID=UPI003522D7F7